MKIANYKNPHSFMQNLINSWDLMHLVKESEENQSLKNRKPKKNLKSLPAFSE
jgi:hypothetical protein